MTGGRSFELLLTPALRSVIEEREAQDKKWGEQNHNPHTYLAILVEEVGEFAQVSNDIIWGEFGGKDGHHAHLRREAVQVAAVALAIVECLDRGKWEW